MLERRYAIPEAKDSGAGKVIQDYQKWSRVNQWARQCVSPTGHLASFQLGLSCQASAAQAQHDLQCGAAQHLHIDGMLRAQSVGDIVGRGQGRVDLQS